MNKIENKTRNKIIVYFGSFRKQTEIAKILGISLATVRRVIASSYSKKFLKEYKERRADFFRTKYQIEIKRRYKEDEAYREMISNQNKAYRAKKILI